MITCIMSPSNADNLLHFMSMASFLCAICSVNLKRQPATEWVINLASVTSSPTAQTFSKNSDVLIDSGTAGLSLPPADLQALYNLLGLGPVMSGGLLFPVISCANIANLPTLTFTFSGTVNGGPPLALTLLPTDYVSQQVDHHWYGIYSSCRMLKMAFESILRLSSTTT